MDSVYGRAAVSSVCTDETARRSEYELLVEGHAIRLSCGEGASGSGWYYDGKVADLCMRVLQAKSPSFQRRHNFQHQENGNTERHMLGLSNIRTPRTSVVCSNVC